jgi:uncharacterized protein DUF3291
MTGFHLAQLNVAIPRAPLTDPVMAGFVAGLPVLNAIADAAPGFVWRLVDDGGADATGLRPFGGDIMVNMSVWESVEALRAYTYRVPEHLEALRRRREFFAHEGLANHLALWWIPAGTIPTLAEARERLAHLDAHGPTAVAFTLRTAFPAPAHSAGSAAAR